MNHKLIIDSRLDPSGPPHSDFTAHVRDREISYAKALHLRLAQASVPKDTVTERNNKCFLTLEYGGHLYDRVPATRAELTIAPGMYSRDSLVDFKNALNQGFSDALEEAAQRVAAGPSVEASELGELLQYISARNVVSDLVNVPVSDDAELSFVDHRNAVLSDGTMSNFHSGNALGIQIRATLQPLAGFSSDNMLHNYHNDAFGRMIGWTAPRTFDLYSLTPPSPVRLLSPLTPIRTLFVRSPDVVTATDAKTTSNESQISNDVLVVLQLDRSKPETNRFKFEKGDHVFQISSRGSTFPSTMRFRLTDVNGVPVTSGPADFIHLSFDVEAR